MSEQPTEKKAQDMHESGSKKMLSQGVHVGFLLLGVLLSLAVFLSLQSFTAVAMNDDYKKVSQATSDIVIQEFEDMEFSLRTVSTLLALSNAQDNAQIIDKINMVERALLDFSEVIWLRKVDGAWDMMVLHESLFKNSRDLHMRILKEKEVQKAIGRALEDDSGAVLVPNIHGDDAERMFAMIQSTGNANGVLIGLSNFRDVFQPSKLNMDALIAAFTVRDVTLDQTLYEFERKRILDQSGHAKSQRFDINIGGRTLEIHSRFYKKKDVFLLAMLPYIVLGFSLILTAIVTFYLRSNYMQSLKFVRVNDDLIRNNDTLQAEIKKREELDLTAKRADQENRAIIDSVSDIIFETDIMGKILFLNARWVKITGFEIEQSVGLELFKILHPQDQADVQKEFDALIKGRIPSFRKFTRLRTSDGTFRAAELAVSTFNQDDASVRRVVGTFTDVEERRRAERALSEAERKYRNIVQNAAGGIFQMTPEGLYLSANPAMAEVLGYESPEQILREVKNANRDVYVDAAARSAFVRELEKVEIITNHETQIKRRDGSAIWVNENIHTVRDDTGAILYLEGSIEDITSRVKSAIALEEAKMHSDLANRAKSEFLANMSHELRTPLNSIIGFSEMIKGQVLGQIDQDAYVEYAKDINDSGKSLLNVINEILDISKIEAGERQLNESQIRVDRIASSCVDLLGGKIENADITVTNNLEGMPEIIGEDLSVKQVFMNLLSNAVKFTPSGGRVSLSYEVSRDGDLHVCVTDTGIGLDEAEVQKALSPFGQTDNDLDRDGSGTGLGLTLVDALLKLHGGSLDLVSQKGIGTTATAIFPKDRVVMRKIKSDIDETLENNH